MIKGNRFYSYAALMLSFATIISCSSGGGGSSTTTTTTPTVTACSTGSSYTVSGKLYGLAAGQSVTLVNNINSDTVALSADGAFSFPLAITDGGSYEIAVMTQPGTGTCTVYHGAAGSICETDVADIAVGCTSGIGAVNVLNLTTSGGHAKPVVITAYDANTNTEDASLVYADLTSDLYSCSSSWRPSGTLCNAAGTSDISNLSAKENSDSGATWRVSSDPAVGTVGVLIVDACADGGCSTVSFSEAQIFQMFSDGKATHVRLSVHTETGSVPPAWNDSGWVDISGGYQAVGAGVNDLITSTVTSPKVIATGQRTTRYLRIEGKNDGTLGDTGYIELRSVKLF